VVKAGVAASADLVEGVESARGTRAGGRRASQRRRSGPAEHEVEQACADLPGPVAGQVDHAGDFTAGTEVAGPPDVLVDSERLDTTQPIGNFGSPPRYDFERVPHAVPIDAEPTGQRVDRRVVIGERVCGLCHRPARQQRPRRCEGVYLGRGHHRAGRLEAAPDPLAPELAHATVPEGAWCSRCSRRPCSTARTPQPWQPLDLPIGLNRQAQPVVGLALGRQAGLPQLVGT
jgi:hypothetical protein